MGNCFSDVAETKYQVGGQSLGHAVSGDVEAAQAQALLSGSLAYTSWVNITVKASNLRNKDIGSKSDPMAVLYEQKETNGPWVEVGRTEQVTDNLSPVFVKSFKVSFNFEKLQPMKVVLVDVDKGQNPATVDPGRMDFCGASEFKLSQLITAKGKALTLPLAIPGQAGKSTVTLGAEEISNARELLTFAVSATSLKNLDLLSKSDPFLTISRLQGDSGNNWQPVFKTEVAMNNLNPDWNPIAIKATQLNNGDPYRPLRFTVYDYEASGSHRVIGQVDTTAAKLRELCDSKTPLVLANPSKPGEACGSLAIRSFNVEIRPTFLDYITAGIEISFMVAIDFTGSNGDPKTPTSLHYMAPNGALTPYEEAIHGVGRVIEFYDSDRTFPAFGFGGVRHGEGTSHCFPINLNPQDPQCPGVAGICSAYRHSLSVYGLSGPTLFAPVIKAASAAASPPTAHLRYNVLLILTDGAIMDMDDTINSIIAASSLPLSILIVGVGSGDFGGMEALDSDRKKLSINGRTAERDIVQFVEFRKYKNRGDALAAELLAELPGQFLAYCRARNIMPPAPVAVPSAAPPPQ